MEDGDGCLFDGFLDDSHILESLMQDTEPLFEQPSQHEQLQSLQPLQATQHSINQSQIVVQEQQNIIQQQSIGLVQPQQQQQQQIQTLQQIQLPLGSNSHIISNQIQQPQSLQHQQQQLHQQQTQQTIPIQSQQIQSVNVSNLQLNQSSVIGQTIQQPIQQTQSTFSQQPVQQQQQQAPIQLQQLQPQQQQQQQQSLPNPVTPVTASKTRAPRKRNTTPKAPKAPKASPKPVIVTSQVQNGTPVQTVRTLPQVVSTPVSGQQQVGLMGQKVFMTSNNGQSGQILLQSPQFGQSFQIAGAQRPQVVQLQNGQHVLLQQPSAMQSGVQPFQIIRQQPIQQPVYQIIQTPQGNQLVQTSAIQPQAQQIQQNNVQTIAISQAQPTTPQQTTPVKGKRSIAPKTAKKKSPAAMKKAALAASNQAQATTPVPTNQVQTPLAQGQQQQLPTQLLISSSGAAAMPGTNTQTTQGPILVSSNLGSQPQFIIQQNPLQIRQPGSMFIAANNANNGQTTIRAPAVSQAGTNQFFIRPQIIQQQPQQQQQFYQVQTANGPSIVLVNPQPQTQQPTQIISQPQQQPQPQGQQIQIGNTVYCLQPSQTGQAKPMAPTIQLAPQQNILTSANVVQNSSIQEPPKPAAPKASVNLADLLKETGILNDNSPPNSPIEQTTPITVGTPQVSVQTVQTPALTPGKPQQVLMVQNNAGVQNIILPQNGSAPGQQPLQFFVVSNRAVSTVKQEGQLPPSPDSTTPGIEGVQQQDLTDGNNINSMMSSSLANCDIKDSKKAENSSQKIGDLKQQQKQQLQQQPQTAQLQQSPQSLKLVATNANQILPQSNSFLRLADQSGVILVQITNANRLEYRQRVQTQLNILHGLKNPQPGTEDLIMELTNILKRLEDEQPSILPIQINLSAAAQQQLSIQRIQFVTIGTKINMLPQTTANAQILPGQKTVIGQIAQQKPPALSTATLSTQQQQQQLKLKQEEKVEKEEKPNKILTAIQQQFNVDQKAASNVDCSSPFTSLDDAVKRLLRFHVFDHNPDPVGGNKFDEAFENISKQLEHRRNNLFQRFARSRLLSLSKEYREDMIVLDNLFVASEKAELEKDKKDVLDGKTLNLPPIPPHWIQDEPEDEFSHDVVQNSVKRKLPNEFDNQTEQQPFEQQPRQQPQQQQMVYQQETQQQQVFYEQQSQQSQANQQNHQQENIYQQNNNSQQQDQIQIQPQQQLNINQQPVIEQSLPMNDMIHFPDSITNNSFLDGLDQTASSLIEDFNFAEIENFFGTSNNDVYSSVLDNNDSSFNPYPSDSNQEFSNDQIDFEGLDMALENGHLQSEYAVQDDQMHSAIKSIMNDSVISTRQSEQYSLFSSNTHESSNSNTGLGPSGFSIRGSHIQSSVSDPLLDEAVKSIL